MRTTSALLIDRAIRRWGQPEDITGAVAFLCMPASQYATGIALSKIGTGSRSLRA